MKYQILADVSGDISPVVIKEYGIGLLPMEYTLQGENRVCVEMESRETLKAFYDGQRAGDLTQTTQITPNQYEEIFESYLKEGVPLICLCLSSGLSSTFQSASLAAEELREKYPDTPVVPVDTLAATGGIGVLTERAARNREQGMSLEENVQDLKDAAAHIQHQFMVQDLMYLRRGGRVSTAEAVLGSALSVRPIMQIDPQGKLVVIDKKRGNKQAVKAVVDEFEKHYDEHLSDPVYIIDADASETADMAEQAIREKHPVIVIRRMGLSPIIGAHTGPGMIAVCYEGK